MSRWEKVCGGHTGLAKASARSIVAATMNIPVLFGEQMGESMGDISDKVSIGLWATNLGVGLSGIDDWALRLDRKMAAAKADGADIFVIPEYASEQWLAFRPDGLSPERELAWMADLAPEACRHATGLSARHDMLLVAGSIPWHVEGGQSNRALIFTPEGRSYYQDKLSLTPGEQDPENWNLTPGKALQVITWRGLRFSVLICLDIEMPALSCLIAPQSLDLLLVPSMTAKPSGYNRVFGCAKARAVEQMCAVAVVGTTGTAVNTTQNPTNYSGCAVYVPCEPELGYDGVFARIDPDWDDGAEGPLLVARDVPIGVIRQLRAGDAEVWPGGWAANHVSVVESN